VGGTGIAFVIIAAMVAYQEAYLLTARLCVDSGRLVRTAWFNKRQECRVEDIGQVRRRSIAYLGAVQPAYLVEDKRGRPAFWLLANRWDESAIDALWQRIGTALTGSWDDSEDYEQHSDLPRW
jgi:hypothetical protein